MNIKNLLILILFFFNKNLMANNYMMNCMSPDFKSAVFYKYIKSEEKLFSRSVKKKWKNFCIANPDDEEVTKITCLFNNFSLVWNNIIGDDRNYTQRSLMFNFDQFTLIETKKIFKKAKLDKEVVTNYKCRKIKI